VVLFERIEKGARIIMYIVIVQVHVQEDKVDEFLEYTIHNATQSRREPACLRFDVLRTEGDSRRFVLHEVYTSAEGQKAHQQTEHYANWRENAPPLLAEPRASIRCVNVSPTDAEWSEASPK